MAAGSIRNPGTDAARLTLAAPTVLTTSPSSTLSMAFWFRLNAWPANGNNPEVVLVGSGLNQGLFTLLCYQGAAASRYLTVRAGGHDSDNWTPFPGVDYHISCVETPSGVAIYANNTLIHSGPAPSSPFYLYYNLFWLGGDLNYDQPVPNAGFDYSVGDLTVWSGYALTEADRLALRGGASPSTIGTGRLFDVSFAGTPGATVHAGDAALADLTGTVDTNPADNPGTYPYAGPQVVGTFVYGNGFTYVPPVQQTWQVNPSGESITVKLTRTIDGQPSLGNTPAFTGSDHGPQLVASPTIKVNGGAIRTLTYTLTSTGNTTSGSKVITGIGGTASLSRGLRIGGSGLPVESYITSIDSSSQVTSIRPATATASNVSLSFTRHYFPCGGAITFPLDQPIQPGDTVTVSAADGAMVTVDGPSSLITDSAVTNLAGTPTLLDGLPDRTNLRVGYNTNMTGGATMSFRNSLAQAGPSWSDPPQATVDSNGNFITLTGHISWGIESSFGNSGFNGIGDGGGYPMPAGHWSVPYDLDTTVASSEVGVALDGDGWPMMRLTSYSTGTSTVTGTTSVGSKVITGISPNTNAIAAQYCVGGTGIPARTQVASVDSSSQVTLNTPATASGTVTLQFDSPTRTIVTFHPELSTKGQPTGNRLVFDVQPGPLSPQGYLNLSLEISNASSTPGTLCNIRNLEVNIPNHGTGTWNPDLLRQLGNCEVVRHVQEFFIVGSNAVNYPGDWATTRRDIGLGDPLPNPRTIRYVATGPAADNLADFPTAPNWDTGSFLLVTFETNDPYTGQPVDLTDCTKLTFGSGTPKSSGNVSDGSPVVINVTNADQLVVGMPASVVGDSTNAHLPAGTVIQSIDLNASPLPTVTLSHAATGGTGSYVEWGRVWLPCTGGAYTTLQLSSGATVPFIEIPSQVPGYRQLVVALRDRGYGQIASTQSWAGVQAQVLVKRPLQKAEYQDLHTANRTKWIIAQTPLLVTDAACSAWAADLIDATPVGCYLLPESGNEIWNTGFWESYAAAILGLRIWNTIANNTAMTVGTAYVAGGTQATVTLTNSSASWTTTRPTLTIAGDDFGGAAGSIQSQTIVDDHTIHVTFTAGSAEYSTLVDPSTGARCRVAADLLIVNHWYHCYLSLKRWRAFEAAAVTAGRAGMIKRALGGFWVGLNATRNYARWFGERGETFDYLMVAPYYIGPFGLNTDPTLVAALSSLSLDAYFDLAEVSRLQVAAQNSPAVNFGNGELGLSHLAILTTGRDSRVGMDTGLTNPLPNARLAAYEYAFQSLDVQSDNAGTNSRHGVLHPRALHLVHYEYTRFANTGFDLLAYYMSHHFPSPLYGFATVDGPTGYDNTYFNNWYAYEFTQQQAGLGDGSDSLPVNSQHWDSDLKNTVSVVGKAMNDWMAATSGGSVSGIVRRRSRALIGLRCGSRGSN